MAYWDDESCYQDDEFFNLYPQGGALQFAQTLPSMASFGHENRIYDPSSYYGDYDSAITFSAFRCSASSFSQPLLIQYDPRLYDSEFNPNSTKFVVSYSVSESGEAQFEEYNPTPYAGGYDPAQTYGKPLPASGEICHPRSPAGPVSQQASEEKFEQKVKTPIESENQKGKIEKEKENGTSAIGSQNGGDKEAVMKDGSGKGPQISQIPTGLGLEAIDEEEDEEEEEESDEASDGGENGGNREAVKENENVKVPQIGKIPAEAIGEEEEEESEETDNGGETGEVVHGYENAEAVQVSQIPSGYGLEAMDLCESLFGYWPCLAKMNKKREERANGCREIDGNEWSIAADYLFGSSDPYAQTTDDGRSSAYPLCCYDRHYQVQSYHG